MASPQIKRALDALEAAQMYLLIIDQMGYEDSGASWEWFNTSRLDLGDLAPTVRSLVDVATRGNMSIHPTDRS